MRKMNSVRVVVSATTVPQESVVSVKSDGVPGYGSDETRLGGDGVKATAVCEEEYVSVLIVGFLGFQS